jgi:hypothetical protein
LIGRLDASNEPVVETTSSPAGETRASTGTFSSPESTKTERFSPVLTSRLSGAQSAMDLTGVSESWKRRFPVEGFSWGEEEEAVFLVGGWRCGLRLKRQVGV